VYFGEESVAAEYQGIGTYANGMIRYDLDAQKFLDLLDEYEKTIDQIHRRYDRQGPNGAARIEFVVNIKFLDRLNEMTVHREWIPK
jgi:hypothetical protein